MEKHNIIKFAVAFACLALLINFASAFGVSSPYWKGNPLLISPGESSIVSLRMQNMVGDEDVSVKVQLVKGEEIAYIEEKEYFVKAGTKDSEVPVTISIPSDAAVGSTYQVTISFKTIAREGEGTVAFGTGMDTTFDVLVTEKEKKSAEKSNKGNIIMLIMGIVLIVGLVVFYMKKRNFR